ncbi:MAG: AmmeMemoRadiSam system protein B, partial [Thermoanaerobaculia bacterium]
MRQGKGRTLLMLPLLTLLWILPSTSAALAKGRPAAVAGAFYSADPAKLRAGIEAYLEDALPARSERPLALIAPHAGYIYSGQIAADAYGQAIGRDYDLIVILGTNHTAAGFKGVSVYDGSGYNTPLG